MFLFGCERKSRQLSSCGIAGAGLLKLNAGEGLEVPLANPLGVASVSHRNPQRHHRADDPDDGQGHASLRHDFDVLVDLRVLRLVVLCGETRRAC